MQKDAAGTITDVMRRIGKLPKATQAGMLTDLFGSESVGAIAPLLTQLPRLSTNLQMAADRAQYAGSMQAEFDGQNATTAAGLDRLQNRLDRLKIRLGDQLLPVIEKAGGKIGALAGRMTDFAARHPRLTQAAMMGAAALSLAMIVIGGLAVAIGTTFGPLAYLVTALRTPAAAASFMQRALQLLFAPLRFLFGLIGRLSPDAREGRGWLVNYYGRAVQDVDRAWDSMLRNLNMPETKEWKSYVLRHSLATLVRNRGAERWDLEGFMGHRSGSQTKTYAIGDFPTVVTALDSIISDLDALKPGALYRTVTGAGQSYASEKGG